MAVILYDIFSEYDLGNLIGQRDWEPANGWDSPLIQNSVQFEGRKTIDGHFISQTYSRADKDLTGGENLIQWLRWEWRTSNKNEACPYIYSFKNSLIASLVGYHSGYYQAFNGNGEGGGSYLSTGFAGVDDDWVACKIKLDIPNKKYDFYVDDMETPKLSDLGFRHDSFDLINRIHIYMAGSSNQSSKYMADLIISDCDPDCDCCDLLSSAIVDDLLLRGDLR